MMIPEASMNSGNLNKKVHDKSGQSLTGNKALSSYTGEMTLPDRLKRDIRGSNEKA